MNTMKIKRIHKSRRLAFLLRHDRSYRFDSFGWREVSDLLMNHDYSYDELSAIVAENNKQRFEFSEDGRYIRARQGHSIAVDVELTEMTPPEVLYHGTSTYNVAHILSEGILPMTRLHVHLSADVDTAAKVGSRHGEAVVLVVDAAAMSRAGHKFFVSRNGVWLVDRVDAAYVTLLR